MTQHIRITCPSCAAIYEVDESVIPEAGRDVQCSNCGTTWWQGKLSGAEPDTADAAAPEVVADTVIETAVEEAVETAVEAPGNAPVGKAVEAAVEAPGDATVEAVVEPEEWASAGAQEEAEAPGQQPEHHAESETLAEATRADWREPESGDTAAGPDPEPEAPISTGWEAPETPEADAEPLSEALAEWADRELAGSRETPSAGEDPAGVTEVHAASQDAGPYAGLREALGLEPEGDDEDDEQDEQDHDAPAFPAVAADGDDPVSHPPQRSLDEAVLGVLREEAELEAAARRAESPIESQPELGLDDIQSLDPAVRDRLELEPLPGRPRTAKLPDVDELTSTLGTGEAIEDMGESPYRAFLRRRTGFRIGFTLMMLVVIAVAMTYSYAQPLSQRYPQYATPIEAMTVRLDRARLWLDRAVIGASRRIEAMTDGN